MLLATGTDHPRDLPAGVEIHPMFPYVRGRGPLGRAVRRMHMSRPVNGVAHLVGATQSRTPRTQLRSGARAGGGVAAAGRRPALMLRASGRPIVYTPHNTFDRSARSYARANALIRRCAARIVVHSNYDRAALPAAQAAKTVVIAHGEYGALAGSGSPDADPASARAELGAHEDELVVLLFGQLRPDKGIRDLLLAGADVPRIRIVLAGEDNGALDEVADLLADERLRDRVIVQPGYASAAQTGRLFAASRCRGPALLPSERQRCPAAGYGYARPVLVYPVGGLPEYVEEGQHRLDLRGSRAGGRTDCRLSWQPGARSAVVAVRRRNTSRERFAWDRSHAGRSSST